jgi:MFS family permease
MTPFQSGLVTFAGAVGAIGMKAVASRTISRFGFRNVLLFNAVVSSIFIAACAIFTPGMAVSVLIVILLIGGFFRALEFTAINAIAYADIDPPRMSRATALASVGQQLSISTGVAVGALMVELSLRYSGSTTIQPSDFTLAFIVVALISGSSALIFRTLPVNAGAEMSGHLPAGETKAEPIAAADTSDQRMG